jgi:hypothetical protein
VIDLPTPVLWGRDRAYDGDDDQQDRIDPMWLPHIGAGGDRRRHRGAGVGYVGMGKATKEFEEVLAG